ncbi:MAG: 30S ribosomal protein S24e [Methanomicrobiales archaeon]|nr:30S ribosomal protein S24e [Methanomicrobiales archaeon]
MEFEFVKDCRNDLLGRREIEFLLSYDGATPARAQVQGKLCAVLSLKESCVVIDTMKTAFGAPELRGIARVYDSEDGKVKIERPYLSARGKPKPKEGEEPGEAPKEAPKEATRKEA